MKEAHFHVPVPVEPHDFSHIAFVWTYSEHYLDDGTDAVTTLVKVLVVEVDIQVKVSVVTH